MKNSKYLAIIGMVLVLPAAILVSSGIFRFSPPQTLISPFIVMAGLLSALVLNLLTTLRVGSERDQSGHVAAVTVRIGVKPLNLAIVAIGSLLSAVIFGYLIVENFQPR